MVDTTEVLSWISVIKPGQSLSIRDPQFSFAGVELVPLPLPRTVFVFFAFAVARRR